MQGATMYVSLCIQSLKTYDDELCRSDDMLQVPVGSRIRTSTPMFILPFFQGNIFATAVVLRLSRQIHIVILTRLVNRAIPSSSTSIPKMRNAGSHGKTWAHNACCPYCEVMSSGCGRADAEINAVELNEYVYSLL